MVKQQIKKPISAIIHFAPLFYLFLGSFYVITLEICKKNLYKLITLIVMAIIYACYNMLFMKKVRELIKVNEI